MSIEDQVKDKQKAKADEYSDVHELLFQTYFQEHFGSKVPDFVITQSETYISDANRDVIEYKKLPVVNINGEEFPLFVDFRLYKRESKVNFGLAAFVTFYKKVTFWKFSFYSVIDDIEVAKHFDESMKNSKAQCDSFNKADVNALVASKKDLLTYIVKELKEAIKDQERVIYEEFTIFNKGWLHSFKDALGRYEKRLKEVTPEDEIKIYTASSFQEAKKDFILQELQENLYLEAVDAESEYNDGRIAAWQTWLFFSSDSVVLPDGKELMNNSEDIALYFATLRGPSPFKIEEDR